MPGEPWLPEGTFDACPAPAPIPDGTKVVLAFDGSYNGDSSALVACTVDGVPHLDVVEVWEPAGAPVSILDVEQTIRDACGRFEVVELCADPYRWARTLELLADEGLPVVVYPQSAQRMTPACTRFFEAVVNGQLTHSGDPRLVRHVANATFKEDARGARITKESKSSRKRIDAAVCAVMAFDRAAQYEPPKTRSAPWALYR
jgi:hypothetical protein